MTWAILAGLSPAAETTTRPAGLPAGDARRGAVVKLALDKDEYLLGENVLLHFGVVNAGSTPFAVSFGGDYRGSMRPLRFTVQAFDAHGRAVDDPYPTQACFGGIGSAPALRGGEEFWTSLPLMRYRDFDRDDEYLLRVHHDLGWEGDANSHRIRGVAPCKAPSAEIRVRFRIPSRREAREVVERMRQLPADPSAAFGKRMRPHADWTAPRHPVYLPALTELTAKADANALTALGAMATPEATRALIELAAADGPLRSRAEELIVRRLPEPTMADGEWWATRRRMVRLAWRDELAPSVRSLGLSMMLDGNFGGERFRWGCEALRCLGRGEDLPRLTRVFDRALAATKDDAAERQYPEPWTANGALSRVCQRLLEAGAPAPASPRTGAEGYLFLVALARRADFRPAGWRQTAAGLLRHEAPFLRATAASSLPVPLDASLTGPLAALIEPNCPFVAAHACMKAAEAKEPALAAPLRRLLRTVRDNSFLPRIVRDAAVACGVPRDEAMEICIARLGEANMTEPFFVLLLDSVETRGWGCSAVDWPAAGPTLSREWTAFLQANRQAVRDGRKFAPGKLPLIEAMFPRGFSVNRPDGTEWPRWPRP